MTTETTSTTSDDQRTFNQLLEFINHLHEDHVLVRLLIDPDEPFRGQDSHEASVRDIHAIDEDGNKLDDDTDETDVAGTRYVFKSDQLFEGDFPDNYTEETIHYRFTIPNTDTISKSNIEIEANYNTSEWNEDEPDWQDAGYLVGGGVMVYFK